MFQSRTLNKSTCLVHPPTENTSPQDTTYMPESFQRQRLRRRPPGRVQSLRSMPSPQGSNGLRDRGCMMHSAQCPTQRKFQASRAPILKLWMCRQGNTARPDKASSLKPDPCLALSMNRQDKSRHQRRLHNQEDSTSRRDKGSTLQWYRCPG